MIAQSHYKQCHIDTLLYFKIETFADRKNVGIWFNDNSQIKKVAAIGVRVSKWIAYHGFSININNDLNEYRKIIPCGLDNNKITSIYNEGYKFKNINHRLRTYFKKIS